MTRGSWITGGLSDDAARSYAELVRALLTLDDRGERAPCQEPATWHLWTSDDRDEREAATWRCQPCPIRDVCARHAPHEKAGVWAAVDLGPTERNNR